MAYRVLEAESLTDLERQVEEAERKGFKSQGGFTAAPIAAFQGEPVHGVGVGGLIYVLRYFQAVTK